jgi:O-antigen/teichoic acid export membrane protein
MNRSPSSGISARTLSINMSATVGARLLVPVLNVALVASIARLGGAAALGRYTLLVTLFLIAEHVKSLGLPNLLVREVAQDRDSAVARFRSLVRIGYWGALFTAPLIFAVVWIKDPSSPEMLLSAAFMCLGLWPSSQVMANEALFLACDRASYIFTISLLESTLRWAASLFVLLALHGSVASLVIVYAGSRFVAAAAGAIARRRLRLPDAPYESSRT